MIYSEEQTYRKLIATDDDIYFERLDMLDEIVTERYPKLITMDIGTFTGKCSDYFQSGFM